mgnify:CR=1 FL=1
MTGSESHRRKNARRVLAQAGYKAGGHLHHEISEREDEASDRKMISKAIEEHDDQLHGGKKTRLHLADGGSAMGDAPMSRPDRSARGSKGKGKAHTNINVIMAPGGGQQQPPQRVPVPVPMPPGAGAGGPPPMPPPRPPMGPPPGAMPPGLAGGMPPGGPPGGGMPPGMPMRKVGGRAPMAHLTAGKGSGVGRLELSKEQGHDKEMLREGAC